MYLIYHAYTHEMTSTYMIHPICICYAHIHIYIYRSARLGLIYKYCMGALLPASHPWLHCIPHSHMQDLRWKIPYTQNNMKFYSTNEEYMFGSKAKRGADFPTSQPIKLDLTARNSKNRGGNLGFFSQRRKTTFPSTKRKQNPSTYFNKKTSKFPKQGSC